MVVGYFEGLSNLCALALTQGRSVLLLCKAQHLLCLVLSYTVRVEIMLGVPPIHCNTNMPCDLNIVVALGLTSEEFNWICVLTYFSTHSGHKPIKGEMLYDVCVKGSKD